MHAFLARVRALSDGLVYIDPVSTTDPGFGNRPPTDPGYGRPGGGWSPVDPGFGRPGWSPADPGYGHPTFPHPGNPLPVPPVDGVVTPPIVLPERPQLPAGAGIVVPLPDNATVPAPTGEAPAPGTKPHILWYGPGTQPSVVYLAPATAAAAPK